MSAPQYKCGGCDKFRNAQRFSNNALRKYDSAQRSAALSKKPREVSLPLCQNCSGQQRHELKCSQCGVVKELGDFSSNMRRNPDNAECRACVQEREDREPEHHIETEEQEIIARIKSGLPLSGFGNTAFDANFQHHQQQQYSHPSYPVTNTRGLTTTVETDDGGWIVPPVEVPQDPQAARLIPITTTNNNKSDSGRGLGGSGFGRRQRRLSQSSSSTTHTFQSNATGRTTGSQWDEFEQTHAPYREQQQQRLRMSGSNVSGSGGGSSVADSGIISRFGNMNVGGGNNNNTTPNPGFAKQGAVKKDSHTRAQIQLERERRRKQEQEEQAKIRGDGDDSDNDDDDNDSDEDEIDKYGY